MITIDNLREVLTFLGFEEENEVYTKRFETSDCEIKVDFKNKRIVYPEVIDTGNNSTIDFLHAENFVVLECVCRLLDKGYQPADIFLEKAWQLGHTQKSGRADITIYKEEKPYLIIECKEAGDKYKEARKNLFEDPRQLFSYWQQARSTQWLQLYASDFDSKKNEILISEEIIRSRDDENVELLAKEDTSVLIYKNASTAEDAFEVWAETYSKKTYKNIIFGKDAIAYNIGNQPIKNKDLHDFEETKGFIDTFREILRHNAISDKENAFNKMLSLFICKFVDEEQNDKPDDVMAFQYVDGTDNYYLLYERLLALFQTGMKEFLKEEVFYLENDYIKKTLAQFTGKNRNELENELIDKFQKTKMLSCQVFAFREVYNEKLFLQNGKILVEMVEMLQNYRISYTSRHQVLGDLFENLLDAGFKQEAGQFFTPTPITRFVWNSLPIENYLKATQNQLPKVIDFACGSAHFLTEGVSALAQFFPQKEKKISRFFYGCEKDNRLARVSKLALLLNGAQHAKIKATDGLEHDENFLGPLHSFDILVANPPFSVDGFKLHESRNVQKTYETIALMSAACKNIQNVFIERMQHLLKPKGIAAIVMPSSFLSDSASDDIKAREILLKNFCIKALVSLSNATFGKTRTSTVILFLEHYDYPPYRAKLVADSARAIVNAEELTDWQDCEILNAYLERIDTSKEEYQGFFANKNNVLDGGFAPYFAEYVSDFVNLTKTKKVCRQINETIAKEEAREELKKSEKTSQQLISELNNAFYEQVTKTETEKLLYFALTYNQTTFIINAPSDTNKQKEFLGYTISNARGNEGLKETQGKGLLSNKTDSNDPSKLAYYVREAFTTIPKLPEHLQEYASVVKTSDLLEFNKATFDLKIKTNADKKTEITSKWDMVRLENVLQDTTKIENISVRIPQNEILNEGLYPVVSQNSDGIISGYTNTERVVTELPLIVFGDHTCAVKYIDFPFVRGADGTQIIKIDEEKSKMSLEYLYHYLSFAEIHNKDKYERHYKYLKQIRIPLPPLPIQQEIVTACQAIDSESQDAQNTIAAKRKEIEAVMNAVSGEMKKLGEVCNISSGGTPSRKEAAYWTNGTVPWLKSEVCKETIVSSANEYITEMGLQKSSAKYFENETTLIALVGATKGKTAFLTFRATTNQNIAGLKSKDENKTNDKYIFYVLRSMYSRLIQNLQQYDILNLTEIKQIQIPIPSLSVQREIVAKVTALEAEIAAAEKVVAGAAERKKKVLADRL